MDDPRAGPALSEWRAHGPVVAAGTAGMSLAAVATYSMGVLIAPIQHDLGWSRAQISSGPMIVSLVAICLSPIMGAAIDRLGAKLVAIASVIALCAALALLSTTTSNPLTWWPLWMLVGIAGSTMPTVWTAPITRLFNANRGLAIAITLSGSSLGAIVVPPIAGYLAVHYSWRSAYLGLATIWGIIALPMVVAFFRVGPRSTATPPDALRDTPPKDYVPGMTAREGFRSPLFYKIAVGTFGGAFGSTALIVNVVPILNSNGISLAAAASIAGLVGIATMVGRIVGGHLLDRFNAVAVAALSSLAPLSFCAIILAMPGSVLAASIAVVIYGLTMGPKVASVVYLAGRYFGQRSFGTLFGSIQALLALGAGVGPFLANLMFDMTGSYRGFLIAIMPVFVICSLCFVILGEQPQFAPGGQPQPGTA
jgi:MFS family permease